MSAFFRLSNRLQQGIAHTLGWSSLRPVQELTIEAVLAGKNCVVLAPTAGGKTEAAFFPVLDIIYTEKLPPVSALYISPLRALLNNQEPRLERLARLVGLTVFKWHGDVPQSRRRQFLQEPADVLMITPESLEVILIKPDIDKATLFGGLRFAVIDEIHAFAGDDRGAHLVSVLERLQTYSQHDIQRIGLSATVGDPEAILAWQQGSSRRSHVVIDPPRPPTPRLIEIDVVEDETRLGAQAARLAQGRKSLFFVESRRQAEAVQQAMEDVGIAAYVHHSSVARDRREEAEAEFAHGQNNCIVCTSTMELGIDVGDLDLVMQLDAPATVSSFMQRMGRTGRRSGTQPHIAFLAGEDMALVRAIALVNLARQGWIEPVEPDRRAYHVLVHQILAQALQFYGVRQEQLWAVAQRTAAFQQITRQEFDRLIEHLLATGFLHASGGLLVLGEAGEERFGRRNFLELYSVFETPQEVRVVTVDKQDVGMLQTWFVQALGEEGFVFVLAGRRWQTVEVDLDGGLVIVRPAPKGEIPRWSGGAVLLSREVAEAHRDVLLSDEDYPFVHRRGQEHLRRIRRDWRSLLQQEPLPMRRSGSKWELYTFAGGRINTLLARALAQVLDARTSNDNFSVDVEFSAAHPISEEDLWNALDTIAQPDFFSSERLIELAQEINRGRLSKFQPLLRPEQEARFLIDRLFDVEGLQQFLAWVQ
ncbi:MAG: DEAD/DEAH box helicase [Anaerolineae bacterium]